MKRACIATFGFAAALLLSGMPAQAEGVQVVEDFESYSTGIGNWSISDSSGIAVTLGLNLTAPIEGNKDMNVGLGATLLGASYSISNSNLNVPVSDAAESFKFKIKPLVALSVTRNVIVTLTDDNDVSYVSATKALPLLAVNSITDLEFALSAFTPPIVGTEVSAIEGVNIKFTTPVLSLAAQEHIDEMRLTWDNSAVSDWMCY